MDDTTSQKNISDHQQEESFDDVTIESYNDDLDNGEQTPADTIKRLRARVKELTKEKQEYLDGWQRIKADFTNYKKREEEEKSEFLKFAKEGMIIDLLPVLQSFQMAFANKEAWEKVDENWRKGVEYIHQQLMAVLQEQGLTVEEPLGKMFDPTAHTSVGTMPTTDSAKDHLIAEVVQIGYRLNGKIIKPPTVRVYDIHATGELDQNN